MITCLFILIIGILFTLFTFWSVYTNHDSGPVLLGFWVFLIIIFLLILLEIEKIT